MIRKIHMRAAFIMFLTVLLTPLQVSAKADLVIPVVSAAVEKVVKKIVKAGKLRDQLITVSANDFFDTDLNQNMPLSEHLRDVVIGLLKKEGVRVRVAAGGEAQQWSFHGQWKKKGGTIYLTGIARLRDSNGPERAIVRSARFSENAIGIELSSLDQLSAARTIIRTLEQNSNYKHIRTVHLRPVSSQNDDEQRNAAKYFENILKLAVSESSLLRLVDQKSLYKVPMIAVRTRGIRKKPKKNTGDQSDRSMSLASDLLQTESELIGNLKYEDPNVKVSVQLNDRTGIKIASAERSLPVALFPKEVIESLKNVAKKNDISRNKGFSINGLAVELATSRGEGESVYSEGDLMRFFIRVNRDSFLYLFDLDSAGNATMLFPDSESEKILMKTGVPIILPDDSVDYDLEVQSPFGRDTVLVVASEIPLALPKGVSDGITVQKLQDQLEKVGRQSKSGYAESVLEITTRAR